MQAARLVRLTLIAALASFSQTASNQKTHGLLRFTLEERPEQVVKILGHPDRVDDFAKDYTSWQYEQADGEDHDDNLPPAYVLCLSSAGERLMSVTRNFVVPQDGDDLFPPAETTAHHWPSTKASQFSVRLRKLSGGILLLAMGTSQPGERTTQLILIRQSALKVLIPWLAERLR